MLNTKCEVCNSEFYAKPSHKTKGWGRYCSKKCQYTRAKTGLTAKCGSCGKSVYRSKLESKRSNSGKFFCSKSCQAIWRNQHYSGKKHSNWKSGASSYREILRRSSIEQQCGKCKTIDIRVLAVHHIDTNRENNSVSNLMWLCHNCHYLVHHYRSEQEGFLATVA